MGAPRARPNASPRGDTSLPSSFSGSRNVTLFFLKRRVFKICRMVKVFLAKHPSTVSYFFPPPPLFGSTGYEGPLFPRGKPSEREFSIASPSSPFFSSFLTPLVFPCFALSLLFPHVIVQATCPVFFFLFFSTPLLSSEGLPIQRTSGATCPFFSRCMRRAFFSFHQAGWSSLFAPCDHRSAVRESLVFSSPLWTCPRARGFFFLLLTIVVDQHVPAPALSTCPEVWALSLIISSFPFHLSRALSVSVPLPPPPRGDKRH